MILLNLEADSVLGGIISCLFLKSVLNFCFVYISRYTFNLIVPFSMHMFFIISSSKYPFVCNVAWMPCFSIITNLNEIWIQKEKLDNFTFSIGLWQYQLNISTININWARVWCWLVDRGFFVFFQVCLKIYQGTCICILKAVLLLCAILCTFKGRGHCW